MRAAHRTRSRHPLAGEHRVAPARRMRTTFAAVGAGVIAVGAVLVEGPRALITTMADFTTNQAESQSVGSATLAAPTSLGVSCNFLGHKITLTWTASASTFTTGYDIYRGTANGGPYTLQGTVGAVTTYVDSSYNALTTYYYVVQAKKANWTSPNSNQVSQSC